MFALRACFSGAAFRKSPPRRKIFWYSEASDFQVVAFSAPPAPPKIAKFFLEKILPLRSNGVLLHSQTENGGAREWVCDKKKAIFETFPYLL